MTKSAPNLPIIPSIEEVVVEQPKSSGTEGELYAYVDRLIDQGATPEIAAVHGKRHRDHAATAAQIEKTTGMDFVEWIKQSKRGK